MDEKTVELLQQLAAKLGTTAEHLWAVLVRQAFVSGCVDLLCYAVVAAIAWLTVRKTPQWLEVIRDTDSEGAEFAYGTALALSWLLTVIFSIMAFCSIGDTVAAFANPEYWALKQVLAAIGGAK